MDLQVNIEHHELSRDDPWVVRTTAEWIASDVERITELYGPEGENHPVLADLLIKQKEDGVFYQLQGNVARREQLASQLDLKPHLYTDDELALQGLLYFMAQMPTPTDIQEEARSRFGQLAGSKLLRGRADQILAPGELPEGARRGTREVESIPTPPPNLSSLAAHISRVLGEQRQRGKSAALRPK